MLLGQKQLLLSVLVVCCAQYVSVTATTGGSCPNSVYCKPGAFALMFPVDLQS